MNPSPSSQPNIHEQLKAMRIKLDNGESLENDDPKILERVLGMEDSAKKFYGKGTGVSKDNDEISYEEEGLKEFLKNREVVRGLRIKAFKVGGEVRPKSKQLGEDLALLSLELKKTTEDKNKIEEIRNRLHREANDSEVLLDKYREEIRGLKKELDGSSLKNESLQKMLDKLEGDVKFYELQVEDAKKEFKKSEEETELAKIALQGKDAVHATAQTAVKSEVDNLKSKIEENTEKSNLEKQEIKDKLELKSEKEKVISFVDGVLINLESRTAPLTEADLNIIKQRINNVFKSLSQKLNAHILKVGFNNLKDDTSQDSFLSTYKQLLNEDTKPRDRFWVSIEADKKVQELLKLTKQKISDSKKAFQNKKKSPIDIDDASRDFNNRDKGTEEIQDYNKKYLILSILEELNSKSEKWDAAGKVVAEDIRADLNSLLSGSKKTEASEDKTGEVDTDSSKGNKPEDSNDKNSFDNFDFSDSQALNKINGRLLSVKSRVTVLIPKAKASDIGDKMSIKKEALAESFKASQEILELQAIASTLVNPHEETIEGKENTNVPKQIKDKNTGQMKDNPAYGKKGSKQKNPKYENWNKQNLAVLQLANTLVTDINKIVDGLQDKENPLIEKDKRVFEYQKDGAAIQENLIKINGDLKAFKDKVEGATFDPVLATAELSGIELKLIDLENKIKKLEGIDEESKKVLDKQLKLIRGLFDKVNKKVNLELEKEHGLDKEKNPDVKILNDILYNTYGLKMHKMIDSKAVETKPEDYKKESGDMLFSSNPVFQLLAGVDALNDKYGERKWFTEYPHDDEDEVADIENHIRALNKFASKLKDPKISGQGGLLMRMSLANINQDSDMAKTFDDQGLDSKIREKIIKAFNLDRIQDSMSKQILAARENKTLWLTGNPSPKDRLMEKGLTEDDMDFVLANFDILNQEAKVAFLKYVPAIKNTGGNGRITQLTKLLEEKSMYRNAIDRLKGKMGYKKWWGRTYGTPVEEVTSHRMDSLMYALRNEGVRLKDAENIILTKNVEMGTKTKETQKRWDNMPVILAGLAVAIGMGYAAGNSAKTEGIEKSKIEATQTIPTKIQEQINAQIKEAKEKIATEAKNSALIATKQALEAKGIKVDIVNGGIVSAQPNQSQNFLEKPQVSIAQDSKVGTAESQNANEITETLNDDFGVAGVDKNNVVYLRSPAENTKERLNNFANIKSPTDGNFLGFNTKGDAAAATLNQLERYKTGNNRVGLNAESTVGDMISKYAGLNKVSSNYQEYVDFIIKNIKKNGSIKIQENTKLKDIDIHHMLEAISKKENKYYVYNAETKKVDLKEETVALLNNGAKSVLTLAGITNNYGNKASYKLPDSYEFNYSDNIKIA